MGYPTNANSLQGKLRVGTAAWTIPASSKNQFPEDGSHLERYSSKLTAVEVNSSFYKSHKFKTWERWRLSTPDEFAFSVKIPKAITHTARLQNCDALLAQFRSEVMGLGSKLRALLIQLPPSLNFDAKVSDQFFALMSTDFSVPLVIEPRHPTWFTSEAEILFKNFRVCRASVDPPIVGTFDPGEPSEHLSYIRLHGSPKIYYSNYSPNTLEELAARIETNSSSADEVWCIFDNTAEGHATSNALHLLNRLSQ